MMSQNIKQQSGAILVTALILLLVMTLMGVTSMSITTSELKIASNHQAHNSSYEAALSMIEGAKQGTTPAQWLNTNKTAPVSSSVAGAGFDGTASLTYDHCIRGSAGNSLTVESQQGDSSANFGRIVQEIVATGTANSSGTITATSIMVQGVSIKAAQCPE